MTKAPDPLAADLRKAAPTLSPAAVTEYSALINATTKTLLDQGDDPASVFARVVSSAALLATAASSRCTTFVGAVEDSVLSPRWATGKRARIDPGDLTSI